MLELVAQIRVYLHRPVAPDSETLIDLRWQLTSLIFSHVANEDRALFLPLEQDARGSVSELARAFKVELETLIETYEAHVLTWSTEESFRRWDEYRMTALRLLDVLEDRLGREEDQLYSIALAEEASFCGRLEPVERNWISPAWGMREQIFKGPDEGD